MKNLRRFSGASILICVLTVQAFAGEIHTGIAEQPSSSSESNINVMTELAMNILQSILPVF